MASWENGAEIWQMVEMDPISFFIFSRFFRRKEKFAKPAHSLEWNFSLPILHWWISNPGNSQHQSFLWSFLFSNSQWEQVNISRETYFYNLPRVGSYYER